MRIFLLIAVVLVCFTSSAQNCNYYLLQNNKKIENAIYKKNGELYGKQLYSVSGLSASSGATTANVKIMMYDKNGTVVSNSTNKIMCKGGVMMMNMKMMLPQDQQQLLAGAQTKGQSIYLEYPAEMKIGDNLKNAQLSMVINRGGAQQLINVLINNRRVDGKEKIKTPAGSWDCLKISYKGKIVVKTLGLDLPLSMERTEWFAPGFGIIKTKNNFAESEITSIR